MQAVSVYFVFNCIRSLIYSIWEAVKLSIYYESWLLPWFVSPIYLYIYLSYLSIYVPQARSAWRLNEASAMSPTTCANSATSQTERGTSWTC